MKTLKDWLRFLYLDDKTGRPAEIVRGWGDKLGRWLVRRLP